MRFCQLNISWSGNCPDNREAKANALAFCRFGRKEVWNENGNESKRRTLNEGGKENEHADEMD